MWQVYKHLYQIRKQHDILKTAVADVIKGQTNMSHKGELQTLTKLNMKHQVCPGETCCMIISRPGAYVIVEIQII